ncbi:HAMP domain-containing sensor histidine kinase [Rhizobium rhizogenes]|uniref:HAMP domain-containing sensor histidine kinase n=1 Tax=Rhizobium rhizogenes TaxID=359 RepID=UPI000DDDD217|nr:HAMP domain-containing sensor histidine kinase [Rhizobium rhizogenes]NTG11810.1 HAMP domain-containing histidine kinase [Rhizobium rhizogenes]NTH21143.1 HAMP domain-containing histidine kinase [Rhizobium rhizogenes]NTH34156.1 HAMP domain-containing histidine kinase [Rhizobium rhizogenes]NTI06422.1 HAMP domain-containing histidine kinase [Rhizobium rhizogenes]NTI13233.1 HAMP domain-containing histidine kinase [Rhizobium rhizogenes]
MRRDNILRSSSFRLALIFSLMFISAFIVTGMIVYQLVRWELQQRQDQTIQETFAVIAAAYGDQDITDLLDTVQTYIKAAGDRQRVFSLVDPSGKVLAGNIPDLKFPEGWSSIDGDEMQLPDDRQYRIFSGAVDGNRLTVGLSRRETENIEAIMLQSFGWASIIVLLLAVSGGGLIALRVQRRFGAVRSTMEHVARGNLNARIPIVGRGDDVDLLSHDINDALARLAATVEGMRQVSADIAHDLKSPLNRLKMTVNEALAKQESGQAVITELEAASAEADRINETFEALLRIAQIEAGARKSRFGKLDLGDILQSLADIYSSVAEDNGQRIQSSLDQPGEIIWGDRELLTQMYANLIENAIRHCPTGTDIVIRSEADAEMITTWVEDNGPGIPEREHGNVFRRLYRLEKSRTSPGNGLGLSLVKAIADLHGARILMENSEPGLRIKIVFPRIDQ